MSDLSLIVSSQIAALKTAIKEIKRGGNAVRPKPHKLLMLLAVLDLADEGLLRENKIYLDSILIRFFEDEYRSFAKGGDWCQPGPPFFHLRNSGFWHHQVKPGRETTYAKLNTSGGGTKRIIDNIEYAYLSAEAFSVYSNAETRTELRQFIMALLSNATE